VLSGNHTTRIRGANLLTEVRKCCKTAVESSWVSCGQNLVENVVQRISICRSKVD
jgi:hypothetical protein